MADGEPKPRYLPVKCAVCNGFGTLKYGELTCHACNGRGYILVPPEKDREEKENGKRKQ